MDTVEFLPVPNGEKELKRKLIWTNLFSELSKVSENEPGIDLNEELKSMPKFCNKKNKMLNRRKNKLSNESMNQEPRKYVFRNLDSASCTHSFNFDKNVKEDKINRDCKSKIDYNMCGKTGYNYNQRNLVQNSINIDQFKRRGRPCKKVSKDLKFKKNLDKGNCDRNSSSDSLNIMSTKHLQNNVKKYTHRGRRMKQPLKYSGSQITILALKEQTRNCFDLKNLLQEIFDNIEKCETNPISHTIDKQPKVLLKDICQQHSGHPPKRLKSLMLMDQDMEVSENLKISIKNKHKPDHIYDKKHIHRGRPSKRYKSPRNSLNTSKNLNKCIENKHKLEHIEKCENEQYLTYQVFEDECNPKEMPTELQTFFNHEVVSYFIEQQKYINLKEYKQAMEEYILKYPKVIQAEDIVTAYADYFRWEIILYCLLFHEKKENVDKHYKNYFKQVVSGIVKKMPGTDIITCYMKFITYEFNVIRILIDRSVQ